MGRIEKLQDTMPEMYALKSDHERLKKRVDDLEKLFKELEGSMNAAGKTNPRELEFIRALLDDLRKEFEQFRDVTNQNVDHLQVTKADKSELDELENRMNKRIKDILRQLLELIPNKDELYKRLADIEKRLKKLELMINAGGGAAH